MKGLLIEFRSLMVLLVLLGVNVPAFADSYEHYAQQGWELKRYDKRKNIRVYLRDSENSKIKTFLATTEVEVPMPVLLALFNDVDELPHWVHRLKEAQVLERPSLTEMTQYVVFTTPPPAKDRDLVLITQARPGSVPGSIEIYSKAVEGKLPPKRGMVRMEDANNYWRFIPKGNGKILIEFEFFGDPGGFIPSWAVNLVLDQSPYYTMKKLKRILRKPQYGTSKNLEQYQKIYDAIMGQQAAANPS